MKSFFKTTFACVLGVFIAGILLFWLFIGSVISLATFSTTPSYTSKENTILILKLEGELTERAKDDPLNILNSGDIFESRIRRNIKSYSDRQMGQ